ncbi:MAG: hypothetical protein H0U07_09360 [Actinobacteria bacterium]|nr:hypothetical protein [Actinomycetota bacterium]
MRPVRLARDDHPVEDVIERDEVASRYTADMSKHAFLGTDRKLKQANQEYADKL